jgi:hypothetical protein
MKKSILLLAALSALFFATCNKSPTKPDTRADLKPRGTITGFVADKRGRPIGGVIVSVSPSSGTPGVSAVTGYFTVTELVAGNYVLSFLHRDYICSTAVNASVGEGQTLPLSDTVNLSYTYYILKGHVVYNGSGVPGVGVSVAGTAMTTLTDENGEYTIPRVEMTQTLKILAAKTGFGFSTLSGIAGVSEDRKSVV